MTPLFEFHHLVRTFPNQDQLVYAATKPVQIPAGRFTLICGKSGVGKSSLAELLNTMACADRRQSKRLTYRDPNGRDHNLLNPSMFDSHAGLRRRFGYLPQERHLSDAFSIWENICLAQGGRACREEFRHLLAKLDLADLSDAKWRRSTATLSGGMAQRIALLRAFHGQTHVFFGDEPVNHLPQNLVQTAVALMIENLQKGTTPIVLCHDAAPYLNLARTHDVAKQNQGVTILDLAETSYQNGIKHIDVGVRALCW